MGLKCGIVGLPNVGKSTLFNALTANTAEAANYPFCTINPNIGIATLADERLQALADMEKSAQTLYATVEFVDIAGLVKGAADNAGLGNRFLSHIRETDGIAHVVRCFDDDNITHVDGGVNPADDIAVINLELILADMATVERARTRAAKPARTGDQDARREIAICEKLTAHLAAGNPARTLALRDDELAVVTSLCLLTMKPVLIIANVKEDGFNDNPHLAAATAAAAAEQAPLITICAQIEADIVDFSTAEKKEWLQENQIQETGLTLLAGAAFKLLNLITYFTVGAKEARAWTIPQGATAVDAAGVIHTDFARGFIRAEVTSWSDFLAHHGETGAREAGKLRLEGRDYVVADGDVMHFRFNV